MSWKYFLFSTFCCLLVVGSMILWQMNISRSTYPNYLYMGATDLSQHKIARHQSSQRSIIFLGSSAVAGSNVPTHSTVADYLQAHLRDYQVFGLGVHQANIVDAMVYYLLSQQYQAPKIVLMGVSPEFFPDRWPSTKAIAHNLELLEKVLGPEQIQGLRKSDSRKLFFIEDLLKSNKVKIPSQELINYRTFLYNLRKSFFGPVMNANLTGLKGVNLKNIHDNNLTVPMLDIFNKIISSHGGRLIVFLEPQLEVDRFYSAGKFDHYRNFIKKRLGEYSITHFDLVDIFPNDAEHFLDFIHLTPEAYQKLAAELKSRLQSEDLL